MNNIVIQRQINREMMRLEKYKTDHILHLLVSVLTIGLWLPAWLAIAIINAHERMKSYKRLDMLENQLCYGDSYDH